MQADRSFHFCGLLLLVSAVLMLGSGQNALANEPPVADAGLARYAATDPVWLDGSGSYDPDGSGPLHFAWQQTSGPMVVLADADTAAPTISGFVQTDEIQECEFELVVSDGESTGPPDTVKVIIVPDFGDSTFQLENPSFDPNKPTIIYFGGGDPTRGDVMNGMYSSTGPGQLWNNDAWNGRSNVISFPSGYYPDSSHYEPWSTYYRYGDLIIAYLSSVAPNYRQPIQVMGWSLGGNPTMDVGIRLNAYGDARYAVHHVTAIDAGTRVEPQFGGSWDLYDQVLELFLNSSVDEEPCWIDFYYGTIGWPYEPFPRHDILWVRSRLDHPSVLNWYRDSIASTDMNQFNEGIVAGAYWSVVGPGKNLRLARSDAYYFEWDGGMQSGSMDLYDETQFPGRLPEPVTLLGPIDGGDPNGALLTCCASENAVGYELLFGADAYRVVDYTVVSDGPAPPNDTFSELPYEETWWTVRARDRYGSTIHADPVRVDRFMLSLPVRNTTVGKRYVTIQDAIDEASNGDEIVVSSGPYPYREDIDLRDKGITLRSSNPQDSAVVASTVIEGTGQGTVVTFSGGQDVDCVLAGFTITGGQAEVGGGIACIGGSSPTIRHCAIIGNVAGRAGGGMYVDGGHPILENCIFNANMAPFFGGGISCQNSELTLKNCVVRGNTGFLGGGLAASSGDPAVVNSIVRDNQPDQIFGTAVVSYCNVEGGFSGSGNIDVDPLFADPDNADFHLQSQAGRWDPVIARWVPDDVTSPCIDTGDPRASVAHEPQPNGGCVNMGAYGGTREASKSQ